SIFFYEGEVDLEPRNGRNNENGSGKKSTIRAITKHKKCTPLLRLHCRRKNCPNRRFAVS
ncbi:MAG TPA: hypothetical protein VEP90_19415, partial [Methylomirabilota bacterium]|nr:hypothetical protein [Methylomirabilota bacterium]